jgi:hypothetical protein
VLNQDARISDARLALQKTNDSAAGADATAIEPGPRSGPLVRMTARFSNPFFADLNAYQAAETVSGAPVITAPTGLTTSSPELDRCDQIAALASRADALAANFSSYVEAARAEGRALIAAGKTKQGVVDDYIRGLEKYQPGFQRSWKLKGQTASATADFCRILAKRRWRRDPAGHILFFDRSDLKAAVEAVQRIHATREEIATNRASVIAASASARKSIEGR